MDKYLSHITALIAIAAFFFSVYQYVDTQRLSEANQRYEQFHRVFEWVAGRTADGQVLVDTQQAMAVYELSEFPEHKNLSLPIIDYYLMKTKDESDGDLFRKALIYSEKKLRSQQ